MRARVPVSNPANSRRLKCPIWQIIYKDPCERAQLQQTYCQIVQLKRIIDLISAPPVTDLGKKNHVVIWW